MVARVAEVERRLGRIDGNDALIADD